jgi:hypothetical protein
MPPSAPSRGQGDFWACGAPGLCFFARIAGVSTKTRQRFGGAQSQSLGCKKCILSMQFCGIEICVMGGSTKLLEFGMIDERGEGAEIAVLNGKNNGGRC